MHTRVEFLKTLEILADSNDPIHEFYNGTIAAKIVAEFRRNGIYGVQSIVHNVSLQEV